MKKSLLIELLFSLSNKEWKELDLWVQSPCFNTKPEVTDLFKYLRTSLSKQTDFPSKLQTFEAIFGPAIPFDDHKLRVVMSFLHKLIEQYLIYKEAEKDQLGRAIKLAGIYQQRQLERHYNRMYKKNKRELEQSLHRSATYHQNVYQLELTAYHQVSSQQRTGALNLQQIHNHLDLAYISNKLRLACLAISHQTVYKTSYQFGLLEALLSYIQQKDLTQLPSVGVYYYAFLALNRPNQTQDFQHFQQILLEEVNQFEASEARDLFLIAINFCTKRHNAGDSSFLRTALHLHEKGLEQGHLLVDGVLSRFTYRNAVTLGLILKEYKWVDQFIHTYQYKLKPSYRESMFSLCKARLEYSRKNYDEALTLLRKSNFKDLLTNLSAKTVQLKIYFELGEYNLLDSHLEAMRTYLRRKQVMGYHKEIYQNTTRLVQKLLEINPYEKEGLDLLQNEIEGTKAIAERSWLLRQVEEMKH